MRSRTVVRLLATLLFVVSPAGAHPEDQHDPKPDLDPGIEEGALSQARSAGKALGRELLTRLTQEFREGGVESALRVCAEVAPAIAARHSTDEVTVRRVSLRVRNPEDRPDPWERAQLLRLERLHSEDRLPPEVGRIVREGTKAELRWLKPIEVSDPCLRCHGDPATFGAELSQSLRELYPEDEAIGYRRGDLRGAISVRIPLNDH